MAHFKAFSSTLQRWMSSAWHVSPWGGEIFRKTPLSSHHTCSMAEMTFRYIPRINRPLKCFAGEPCCPWLLRGLGALPAEHFVRVYFAFEEQSPQSKSGSSFQQRTWNKTQQRGWQASTASCGTTARCRAIKACGLPRARWLSSCLTAQCHQQQGQSRKWIHKETRGENRKAE